MGGGEARVEQLRRRRRRRGNRQQPPLGIGVGVGDATGGLAPRHRRPRSERAPVSLLGVHATAPPEQSSPTPRPGVRHPPPTRRRRGSANRPNTTAAAGALKCRPSSFMRRVSSTRPTDGCCGRPEVRVSRKSRVIFARIRGRRRRKKGERFV